MHEHKQAALQRLKRVEGQIRGIAKMVEEDRYCVEILNQTAAVRSALRGVERLLIDNHANHCIEDAIRSGDVAEQRQKFRELLGIIERTGA